MNHQRNVKHNLLFAPSAENHLHVSDQGNETDKNGRYAKPLTGYGSNLLMSDGLKNIFF